VYALLKTYHGRGQGVRNCRLVGVQVLYWAKFGSYWHNCSWALSSDLVLI